MAPAVMVIFGANGDLTKRLIVPALCHLAKANRLPERFSVIGVDHNDRSSTQWRDQLRSAMQVIQRKDEPVTDDVWQWLAERLRYMQGDFTQAETFTHIAKLLEEQKSTPAPRG